MRASSDRIKVWRLFAAVAGVSIPICANQVRAQESFDLTYDLRVAGSSAKTAEVSQPGDLVFLDLFAIIHGTNDNPRDERLQSGIGGFSSSTGGLLGDLLGLPSPSPFNSLGSEIGNSQDVDGDGDRDIGGDPARNADFYSFRSGVMVSNMPAGGFHVGQVQFEAKALAEGQSTEIRFHRRGGNDDWGGLFILDGEVLDGYRGRIGFGAPVTISYLPTTGGAFDYLSGTIDEHVTITRPTKAAAGTTLLITRGLDVVAGGSLDTRDETGGHGAHEIRVEDATSGNSGGSINTGLLYVGRSGSGTFSQTAGTTRVANRLSVGHDAGSTGILNVSGGQISGALLTVGEDGAGTLDQSGGAVSVDRLRAGVGAQGTGTVEVGGGASFVTNTATIGAAGEGTLRLRNGGTVAVNSELVIGAAAGSRGVMEIEGGTLNAGVTNVGEHGSGRVVQTGGTALISLLRVHPRPSSPPSPSSPVRSYTLNGGTLVTGATGVGLENGAGVFVQNGGVFESGAYLSVVNPRDGDGVSSFTLNGGTVRSDGLSVGDTPLGGEYVQTGGESEFGGLHINGIGKLRYAGGSLRVWKKVEGTGEFDFAGAPVTLMAANNTFLDFSNLTLSNTSRASIVAGRGSLLQFPAGFDAEAAFDEIETEGLVHFAGERLVISASHTIGGTGAIEGDVRNAGVVSPGNSPGTLEVLGSYTQTETGALHIEIGGTGAASFDVLTVAEDAQLDGRLTVALLDGFVPSAADRFTVLAADVLAGAFENAPEKIVFEQGTFDVIYDGESVTLANFVAVPEPTMMALLLVASPLLIGRRRRR